jgi:hypothetical protein
MAGRDRDQDIGISNQTLDRTQADEQIQDPVLADVGEDKEDKVEPVGPANPGLDAQLGLDPAVPIQQLLPPLPPQPPPLPRQPSLPPPPQPQPQPQPQPPIMAVQAYGNQIALLPTFDGEAGADVYMWIAVFLQMARQFNWIDAVITAAEDAGLASVAKNKLIGKAAFWLDTERRGGSETDLLGHRPC